MICRNLALFILPFPEEAEYESEPASVYVCICVCVRSHVVYNIRWVRRWVRPFEYPIPPGCCPENLPAHILSLKSPFLCLISEFCNLHGPKNSVKERFFQLFYTVFLRMAVFRRTFALAIGTQAPPALLDTPHGESAVGGGSPAAGLQRYLKWFHNSFVERSTRNRNKTRDRQVSDDLESLGKCFAYRSISLTGIRLGAGSYDALSSKKNISKRIYLQWRVWSWLRMNASYRLNTCKSRGSMTEACFSWWRPAHGCVTRIESARYSGIALRK